MRSWISGIFAAVVILAAPAFASASSLQIMPINIEVPAPGAASTVTLTNQGGDLLNAQIRIFKWVQLNGQDELVPTRDVVVSPPAVKLQPGKKSVIRVVRIGKTPAATEETYRLIIDELPKPVKAGQAGVGFSVRHSIPVFFSKTGEDVDRSWQASVSKGQFILKAGNAGGRRVHYRDLARTLPWGSTIGTNTVAGTGTGSAQAYTAYGHVPAQATPSAQTYTDTIVVTVTY